MFALKVQLCTTPLDVSACLYSPPTTSSNSHFLLQQHHQVSQGYLNFVCSYTWRCSKCYHFYSSTLHCLYLHQEKFNKGCVSCLRSLFKLQENNDDDNLTTFQNQEYLWMTERPEVHYTQKLAADLEEHTWSEWMAHHASNFLKCHIT